MCCFTVDSIYETLKKKKTLKEVVSCSSNFLLFPRRRGEHNYLNNVIGKIYFLCTSK